MIRSDSSNIRVAAPTSIRNAEWFSCASEIALTKSESVLTNCSITESSKPTVRTFPEFARISASRSHAPAINIPTRAASSIFSMNYSLKFRI